MKMHLKENYNLGILIQNKKNVANSKTQTATLASSVFSDCCEDFKKGTHFLFIYFSFRGTEC